MTDTLARPPVGFERVLAKRALLSALGPLAGLRAEGTVTATASGADVELPPFTYGIPIIDGKAVYARMVKVLPSGEGPKREPLGWTVTSAGTEVNVRAVCGGPSGNLPAGTPIVWQPLPAGLLARGAVGVDGIAGGLAQPGPGRCARVVAFEALDRGQADRVWEAQGEGFPAVIVARTGSTAREPGTIATTLRAHTFTIFVVSANYAGNDERAEEGELLLDAIESTLEGLEDVEGEFFSGPPCELGPDTRERPRNANVHVWSIEATVYYALKRIDVRLSDGVSWQPWATTQIQLAAPEATPLAAKTIVDVTADET